MTPSAASTSTQTPSLTVSDFLALKDTSSRARIDYDAKLKVDTVHYLVKGTDFDTKGDNGKLGKALPSVKTQLSKAAKDRDLKILFKRIDAETIGYITQPKLAEQLDKATSGDAETDKS